MKLPEVAIMIHGEINSDKNALTEEKYKELASAFSSQGFNVKSILYNDDSADQLAIDLLTFDAVLVWVNPVEKGKDRKRLDSMLTEISKKGVFVSTHPEIILKMGTKDILYTTKNMEWGGDTKKYTTYDDFVKQFPESLKESKIRVLKRYRGNGGNGVFKITYESEKAVKVIHAISSNEERTLSWSEFYNDFKAFLISDGLLIDQQWNENIVNGMVRCYLSGTTVAGFGYQEINALYELHNTTGKTQSPPGKRYYFTENCGLFKDLKEIMESRWVPEIMRNLSIAAEMMPVIWDADFFINKINNPGTKGKYTLCEINVSSVSPFPPSAVKFIVEAVKRRVMK